MLSGAHVEVGPCLLVDECDWTGMHWHWGERRFRSLRDLMDSERLTFDRVLREDQTTAPAGRRQPPERSTMPARSEISGSRDAEGMAGYSGSPHETKATTEEEATERQQLGDAMQWLGLLHVDLDTLVRRAGERPLVQTLDDLHSIERSAEQLERIAQNLRTLRAQLRDVVGGHLDTHDRERTERAQKEAAGPSRPGWDR